MITATLPPQPRLEGQRLARKVSVTCRQPCERRPTTHHEPRRPGWIPPPPAGRKGLSHISSLPPLGSTSKILRPLSLLPLPTGATCTSGPGAHTHPSGTSASHEPLRPPYRDKTEVGRDSPRNSNNGFRKKTRHLRKQVRCRLSKRAFNAGRVSVISQHQPLLYDNQLYLPTASRGSDTQYRRPWKHDVAGSSALRRCPWRWLASGSAPLPAAQQVPVASWVEVRAVLLDCEAVLLLDSWLRLPQLSTKEIWAALCRKVDLSASEPNERACLSSFKSFVSAGSFEVRTIVGSTVPIVLSYGHYPYGRKWRGTKKPLDENEREVKQLA